MHLLDVSLSDNLATRCPLEASVSRGGFRAAIDEGGVKGVRWFVFIVVNAEGHAGFEADRSVHAPSVSRVAQAVADIPLGRNFNDSQELLRESIARGSSETVEPDSRRMQGYYIEVSLQVLDAEVDRLRLLPTLLSLPPGDVRQVVDAGKKTFRQSPELACLLKDLGGMTVTGT